MDKHSVRDQVFSIPELITQQYLDLEPKTRKLLSFSEIFSVQRIILTGCGDSYASALAVKHAFEWLTHIPTEVVTAIELSRFYDERQLGFAPHNPLVVAISNSGTGARVAEAAARAKKHGALTIALTSGSESPLAAASEKVLLTEIAPFASSLGIRSYPTAVLALLLLAVRIGEVRGCYTMDQANAFRQDFSMQGELLARLLPDMDATAARLSVDWRDMEAYDFVGSGFDYAAAWYGHAKVFEALGKYAMHINTEEWMHLNLFIRNADKVGTVMIANSSNPANSRTLETLRGMRLLKRPLLLITDDAEMGGEKIENIIRVPRPRYPIAMPLTQFAPLALLAGYLEELLGETEGRGCEGAWAFCKDGAGVKNSRIVI